MSFHSEIEVSTEIGVIIFQVYLILRRKTFSQEFIQTNKKIGCSFVKNWLMILAFNLRTKMTLAGDEIIFGGSFRSSQKFAKYVCCLLSKNASKRRAQIPQARSLLSYVVPSPALLTCCCDDAIQFISVVRSVQTPRGHV